MRKVARQQWIVTGVKATECIKDCALFLAYLAATRTTHAGAAGGAAATAAGLLVAGAARVRRTCLSCVAVVQTQSSISSSL